MRFSILLSGLIPLQLAILGKLPLASGPNFAHE
jgi:hypothetical protein